MVKIDVIKAYVPVSYVCLNRQLNKNTNFEDEQKYLQEFSPTRAAIL